MEIFAMEENYAPRPLTAKQNVWATIKVLMIGGAIFAAIWGTDQWVVSK
jgi:hypothetical protein